MSNLNGELEEEEVEIQDQALDNDGVPISNEFISEDALKHKSTVMMMVSFISNALKQKAMGNQTNYEELINEVKALNDVTDSTGCYKLRQWLESFSQTVSLLNGSCSKLVHKILYLDWQKKDEAVAEVFVHFMGNLVSAQSHYAVMSLSSLVVRLRHASNSTVDSAIELNRILKALRNVLSLIPTGPTLLMPQLSKYFPHKSKSVDSHINYTRNCLHLIEVVPVLRDQILSMIVDRCLQIDVEIQIEVDELETEQIDQFQSLMFQMDALKEGHKQLIDEGSDDDSDAEAEITVLNVKELVDKLDAMLNCLFDYLTESLQTLSPHDVDELYTLFLHIFEKSILPTFKSRYTQFLLFLFTSFHPSFPDNFLGLLASKILDTSLPSVIRISSALYMASFVARAKYIDPHSVRDTLSLLVSWCLAYVDRNEWMLSSGSGNGGFVPDVERFGVFYAVAQAVLYVFCFRWRELVNNVDDADDDGDLKGRLQNDGGLKGFERVILSRFNPLKICSSSVVSEFARITHSLDILYCYSIIERNKRIYLPTSAYSKFGTSSLDSFFPFDPYRLPKSSKNVTSLYNEWAGDDESEICEDENDIDRDEEVSMFVEGSTLEVKTLDLDKMSISPSPGQMQERLLMNLSTFRVSMGLSGHQQMGAR
ncbi:RNA polymerase I-specific transcription initiation factor RRN3 [Paraphysoderma sedebokerense]|nr:RNA polymerase I-specific transcription initiation factor RRN3 [Paraphysoderma sedebokerense]